MEAKKKSTIKIVLCWLLVVVGVAAPIVITTLNNQRRILPHVTCSCYRYGQNTTVSGTVSSSERHRGGSLPMIAFSSYGNEYFSIYVPSGSYYSFSRIFYNKEITTAMCDYTLTDGFLVQPKYYGFAFCTISLPLMIAALSISKKEKAKTSSTKTN